MVRLFENLTQQKKTENTMLSCIATLGAPTRNTPLMWKGTALNGTGGVDFALCPPEENAGVIFLHDEAETPPIGCQTRISLYERALLHPEMRRQPTDILIREKHVTGPTATLAAANTVPSSRF